MDIEYDPEKTTYEAMLELFWRKHSPTSSSSSRQYMSAIFCHGEEQRASAERTKKQEQKKRAQKITTRIMDAEFFYNAEAYHQKYLLRGHSILLNSLALTPSDLITSHVASRLNGYMGGHGSVAQFEEEKKSLGLSPEQIEYVRSNYRPST